MKKKLLILLLLFLGGRSIAQQIIPLQKTALTKENKPEKVKGKPLVKVFDSNNKQLDEVEIEKKQEPKSALKRFGVFGVGNLNKEQLEKFNASGKFSCYIRPLVDKRSNLTFYLSFNKNATNNDSLLASTLIFPEIGNNSFLGTVEWARRIGKISKEGCEHFIAPFFEFSNKNIRASQDTSSGKSGSFHFSTLNYTLGFKYLFHYSKTIENTDNDVYFSISPYLSFLNIPDQDTADYRILLKNNKITDNLWSAGLKVAVQYNNFSIFADFRHVLGSAARVPVRELRGFNSNIGVIFNAEIFGF